MSVDDFPLDEVVPWGRSFREYCRMFDLSPDRLPRSILDCAGGPSNFTARAHRRIDRIVSVDPIYGFSTAQLRERFQEVGQKILDYLNRHPERFQLDQFETPEEVVERRLETMDEFLEDFPAGKREGRYREGSLTELDFPDDSFELALCSHLLFLYDEHLSLDFHRRALSEALRVAPEVRIFPLKNMDVQQPRILPDVMQWLGNRGCSREIHEVPYEFHVGAREMLVVRRSAGG